MCALWNGTLTFKKRTQTVSASLTSHRVPVPAALSCDRMRDPSIIPGLCEAIMRGLSLPPHEPSGNSTEQADTLVFICGSMGEVKSASSVSSSAGDYLLSKGLVFVVGEVYLVSGTWARMELNSCGCIVQRD